MMSCEQVTRAAGDYIERKLRLRDRLGVLAHIAMCKGCRAYIAQFRLTMMALHSLPRPAAAPPSEDLLERFRDQSRKPDDQ